jgi:hypothetical protein
MPKQIFSNNRDRFKTLAENRTNKVISALRVLSHCSNKSTYEYDESDVEKIFKAIDEAVIETKLKFKSKEKVHFKL